MKSEISPKKNKNLVIILVIVVVVALALVFALTKKPAVTMYPFSDNVVPQEKVPEPEIINTPSTTTADTTVAPPVEEIDATNFSELEADIEALEF